MKIHTYLNFLQGHLEIFLHVVGPRAAVLQDIWTNRNPLMGLETRNYENLASYKTFIV